MEVSVDTKKTYEASEGGWGWVVVVAVSYCFGILYGMVNNYALIYNELIEVYSHTENSIIYAAWTGSLSYALQCVFCIIGSILVDFFNPRVIGVIGGFISAFSMLLSAQVQEIQIYIFTYGILLAIGQALLLASTLAILPHYFNKKLSLANGITNAFAAACCSLMPFIFQKIIEQYALLGGFYFLAVLNVIAAFLCLSYTTVLPRAQVSLRKRVKQSFGFDVLKKKKFIIWCAATFIGVVGYLIPIVVIDHHSERVFPEENHVILNIGFGVASGFGALFFGIIGDYTTFDQVHYHTAAFLLYGVVQMAIPFAQNFYVLLGMVIILGIGDGIYLCFIVPIACSLVESAKLSNQATGYYHLIMAPGAMVGPTFAGWLYEYFSAYDIPFYMGGATCIVCALIILLIQFVADEDREAKSIDIDIEEPKDSLLLKSFVDK